jgi:Ca-activated chloride channel family protein
LLTDGEDHRSDPIGAAKLAAEQNVVIFTIGIGTTKGEVIKNRDDQGNVVEFLRHNGEMVVSRMDDGLLTKISEMTGGRYYRASSNDQEIDEIAEILQGMEKKSFSTKLFDRLEERYQPFALLAFLLLFLEFFFAETPGQFRRVRERVKRIGWLRRFGFAAALLAALAGTASADVKDNIREGNRLFKKNDFVGARAAFEAAQIDAPEAGVIRYDVAMTYFAEGKFDDAKREFERALAMEKDPAIKARIAYNLGHTEFASGNTAGAIEAFKTSLRFNPADRDAKYNIEYIKAGKKPKNPPQPKPDKNSGQGDKKDPSKGNSSAGDEKKDANQSQPEEAKNPSDMSRENSDRILQMIQDQESEKMRQRQMQKPPAKNDSNGDAEPW